MHLSPMTIRSSSMPSSATPPASPPLEALGLLTDASLSGPRLRRSSDGPEAAPRADPDLPGRQFAVLAPVGTDEPHLAQIVVRPGDPRDERLHLVQSRSPHRGPGHVRGAADGDRDLCAHRCLPAPPPRLGAGVLRTGLAS